MLESGGRTKSRPGRAYKNAVLRDKFFIKRIRKHISIRIEYFTLENCASAMGLVVVIDVLRAFSTAAYAFAAGATEILLVGEVEQALDLSRRFPDSLMMGEVNGLPVPGFDFGNSPSELMDKDLNGLRLIQRTSAGTQGVVCSQAADTLLVASLVCGRATASWIAARQPQAAAFIITGARSEGALPGWPATKGDEDLACADYIRNLLDGAEADPEETARRVRQSPTGKVLANSKRPEFPVTDLDLCTAVDHFDFAMQVTRRDDLLVLQPVWPIRGNS
jgi:2-phosphosulfolactate phosphatase